MKLPSYLILSVLFTASLWGSGIGNITALKGNVSIERSDSTLPAKLGLSLAAKDIVVTAKDAKAQLTFNDNTIITVGKQSRFSIEEYLFDSTSSSTAKFNMISGTMRAMSGKIGKIAPERFAVKTKTATIGIRGTNFIVDVSSDGSGVIACTQGSIIIRDQNGNSVTVPAGSFVTVTTAGTLGVVQPLTPGQLDQMKAKLQDTSPTDHSGTLSSLPVEIISSESGSNSSDPLLDQEPLLDVDRINADVGTQQTTTDLQERLDSQQLGTDMITHGL